MKPYIDETTVYVEPFVGGMNSAARVAKELKPGQMVLNDINKSLIMMHEKCYNEGVNWMRTDITKSEYEWYKANQPEDPMTAWVGIGYQLLGTWFHSYFPHHAYSTRNGQERCINWLRECGHITFLSGDYKALDIPDNSVVYCDPPYNIGVTNEYLERQFNITEFWQYARELSKRCIVFVSCYDCPNDFETVYVWGDTVMMKQNSEHTVTKRRQECEKLVRHSLYKGGYHAVEER